MAYTVWDACDLFELLSGPSSDPVMYVDLCIYAVIVLGWSGLVFISLLRPAIGLKSVLLIFAVGLLGAFATAPVIVEPAVRPRHLVLLTGIWLLNAIAARWLWRKIARILRESNRED